MEQELTDLRYSDGGSRTQCSFIDLLTEIGLGDFGSNPPQPLPLQTESYDTGQLSHESTSWTSFQQFYGLSAEHTDNPSSVSDFPIDAIQRCGLVDHGVLNHFSGQHSQSTGSISQYHHGHEHDWVDTRSWPCLPGLDDAALIPWSQCYERGLQALNQSVDRWPITSSFSSPVFGSPYEFQRQNPVVLKPHQAANDLAHLPFKPTTQLTDRGSFDTQLYSHGFHGSSALGYPDFGGSSQHHILSLSGGPVESLGIRPLVAGTCVNIQAGHRDEILVDNITANGTNALASLVIADTGQSSEKSTPNSIGSSPGPDMLDCPPCGRFQGDVRRLRFVTVPIVHWQQMETLIFHREHMCCHMKPHICDVCGCGRRFSTSRDLERHQESAHRKSTLECHICFRKFGGKRADNLQRHLQTKHSLEAMYEGPLPFGPL
ncbi:Putative Zinc finger C2H2-type [Colletotrichum destructivum]|uniref:Zinc finger C2H2-type n=1 Tax=Colletotrichum destructivum TaxID=34406 RepID=A0AAX4IRE1_9PEZI|nr:Putative Zinc finger C2H2-type [Colletotrichum destructivum]